MSLADLGLIGNCQSRRSVRRDGAIVWCCMPRFDSAPVFGALLDERRRPVHDRARDGRAWACSATCDNTNVLETRFEAPDGAFRVLDFAPRFVQYDRSFRPTKLVRIVEPLAGHAAHPRVAATRCSAGRKARPQRELGSHHIALSRASDAQLRLTTDVPLSYLDGEPFALTERKHFVLHLGRAGRGAAASRCASASSARPSRYWQRWVKHCDIPPIYQEEVIRSALALKLHCFEDTGAIVAALTTSIPESPGSGPDLGLPLLLAARRLLRARRVPPARPLRGARAVHPLPAQRRLGRARTSISRRSIASTAAPISRSTILTDWPGFQGDSRCASATARRCTSSTTCSARWCWR